MPTLEARGVELAWSARGEGAPVLLLHETAASSSVWKPVSEAVAEEAWAISYDRRGWGASGTPDEYRRTTVEEQSEDAARLIESIEGGPAVACGAGVGAVVALDLALRRPELVAGLLLIEPPLLQLLPEATEALSEDRNRLETAAAAGESPIELYLSGGLPALGAGVSRLPEGTLALARERTASVVAELGLASSWRLPLPRLAETETPSAVVTAPSTPPLLRDAAAALAGRLPRSTTVEVNAGPHPPHLGAPAEVAAIATDLARR